MMANRVVMGMAGSRMTGSRDRRSLEALRRGIESEAPCTGHAAAVLAFRALRRKLSAADARACAPARILPDPVPAGLSWAILRPKGGGLAALAREVAAMGLVLCAPRERVVLPSLRLGAYVSERALLPGYAFVAHPEGRALDFAALEAARGGGPALMREGAPVMLRGSVVEALNAAEIAGAFCCVEAELAARRKAKGRRLQPGQAVRITGGPFEGFIASVRRHGPAERIELCMAGAAGFERFSVSLADIAAV